MNSLAVFFILLANKAIALNNFADVPCGRYVRKLGKIVGGTEAREGEFPWLVSLTRRGGHFCGGSLITKRHVLTAGHCLCSGSSIIPANQIKITLGQHDLRQTSPRQYEIPVKLVTMHPDYSCSKVKHDIAILELEKNVEWSSFAIPACLPTGIGSSEYQTFGNILATVAGWGWTNENTQLGGRANRLQKADVNILDNEKCRQWYKSQGKKTKIQDTQICAGFETGGVDSCWADSGGPLMVDTENANQKVVVGVVSTGIGCGRPFLPGLYTRVSEYIEWIGSVLN